ncbi:MAG: UDP-2,3-diacylglucosamine diphosphatase [Bacteroidota bacterium]
MYKIAEGKRFYFASDFHLGSPNHSKSLEREIVIVSWLDFIKSDAQAIFLVGDIFDFWFEYQKVVPKGFVRFLGKVAELSDMGIDIFLFCGNHDLWLDDYLEKELGVKILKDPVSIKIGKHTFYIGHGDGLGEGDHFFKLIKRVFTFPGCKWLFRWLHPDIGVWIANLWSARSKANQRDAKQAQEESRLFKHCQRIQEKHHHDFYVLGHQHQHVRKRISDDALYFNLGEWIKANTYLIYDGEKADLLHYRG